MTRLPAPALAAFALIAFFVAACGSSSTPTSTPLTATASSAASTAIAATSAATTTAPPSVPASSGSSLNETCPPVADVNSDLGQSDTGPEEATQTFGITCTYPGSIVATKVQFETDTVDTFTTGENAVSSPTAVSGLGDEAYSVSGFLAVLKGNTSVRITSPLSSEAQLEALAHQIVG